MARTITRKKTRRLSEMTKKELQEMIEQVIDRKLAQWLDPDTGLELRPEIIESIERQRREYAMGKRGKSLDEVAARLGLD